MQKEGSTRRSYVAVCPTVSTSVCPFNIAKYNTENIPPTKPYVVHIFRTFGAMHTPSETMFKHGSL